MEIFNTSTCRDSRASRDSAAAREYACSYARAQRDESIAHADAQALATLRAELAAAITAALVTASADAQARADAARLAARDHADIVGADVLAASATIATQRADAAIVAARTYADGLRAASQVPMVFAAATVAAGTSRAMYPGTAAPSAGDVRVHVSEAREIRALAIRARVGPGAARTDTVTLRRGPAGGALVDVGSVSLTGAATRALVPLTGVAFAAGDDLAVRLTTSTGTTLADLVVEVLVW